MKEYDPELHEICEERKGVQIVLPLRREEYKRYIQYLFRDNLPPQEVGRKFLDGEIALTYRGIPVVYWHSGPWYQPTDPLLAEHISTSLRKYA